MTSDFNVQIVDITKKGEHEKYLYRCLAPMPFRKYKKRQDYLEVAVPKGLHKKLLIFGEEVVGQIEYAPTEVSGYSIIGENVIVMNCVWVLRKARGHNFGRHLLTDMMKSEKNACGFATIELENHWSPWLKKEQMEKLGFEPIDSIRVTHKTKHNGQRFKIHLMWLPAVKNTNWPTWDKPKLLEGVDFCLAHPIYHPEKPKLKEILEKC